MQTGCGVRTKRIRGRPCLYFWHYEERGGRRVQAFRYLGAARSEAARAKLTEALDAYLERVTAEIRRKRAEVLARALPEGREAVIAGRGHRNPGNADSGAALRDVPRGRGRGATRLDVAGRHDRQAAPRGRPRGVPAAPRPREGHAPRGEPRGRATRCRVTRRGRGRPLASREWRPSMIEIQRTRIDVEADGGSVRREEAAAIVRLLGTVRAQPGLRALH